MKSMVRTISVGLVVLLFSSFSARAAIYDGGGETGSYFIHGASASDMWTVIGVSATGVDTACASGQVTVDVTLTSTSGNSAHAPAQPLLFYPPCILGVWFNRTAGWGRVTVNVDFQLYGASVAHGELDYLDP